MFHTAELAAHVLTLCRYKSAVRQLEQAKAEKDVLTHQLAATVSVQVYIHDEPQLP